MKPGKALCLDWSNPRALHAAWQHLSIDQTERLKQIWQKPKSNVRLRQAFGRKRHAYVAQGSVLAMSNWVYADDFCNCGLVFNKQISRCGHWKFCCACSHSRKWDALCRFALHFQRTEWQFVTISFAGGVEDEDLAYFPLQSFWNVARRAVERLARTGQLHGCLWREELQVISFCPLRLRPHLHAVSDAPAMDANKVEAFIHEKLGRELAALPPTLNVDCRGMPSAYALCNRLSYVNKEIALVRPYREARARIGPDGDCTGLNLEVERFLRVFSNATERRIQRGFSGTLHPLHSDYFGTRPEVFKRPARESSAHRERRQQHFQRVAQVLEDFDGSDDDEQD